MTRLIRSVRDSRSVRALTLLAVTAIVLTSAAWRHDDNTSRRSVRDLQTTPAVVRPMTRLIRAHGQLDAWRSTRLISKCYWDVRILSLVPEGTLVKKGEVVCRLDASGPKEYAMTRRIRMLKMTGELAVSRVQQKLIDVGNRRRSKAAGIRLSNARSMLDEYELGNEPLMRNRLRSERRMAQIRRDQSAYARDEAVLMYRAGMSSRGEVDTRELTSRREEQTWHDSLAQERLHENYLSQRELYELKGTLADAKSEAAYIDLRNELTQRQADFARLSDERRLAHYKRYLGYATDSIAACTIRAPHEGRVVYANDWHRRSEGRNRIEEGAEVDYRQAIVDLPDYSRFVLNAWIHESVISDVAIGQPADVVVPALQDRKLTGRITKIGRFPATRDWSRPGLKEFSIQIEFDADQDGLDVLSPRMDASATVLVERTPEILQVPIECVTNAVGSPQVIVAEGNDLVVRDVELGRTDEANVEVTAGVLPDDELVIDPQDDLLLELVAGEQGQPVQE